MTRELVSAEKLFNDFFNRGAGFWDEIAKHPVQLSNTTFPRYDVTKEKDGKLRVDVALAGYTKENISIYAEDNFLSIKGNKQEVEEEYTYKGIANRAFTLTIPIGRNINVDDAEFVNGILSIHLSKEDESNKLIPIR